MARDKNFDEKYTQEIENTNYQSSTYNSEQNPYSVTTKQKAFKELEAASLLNPKDFPDFSVQSTHLYMKFKPKNEIEEREMKSDSTYFVFDYPLHLSEMEEEAYLKNRSPLKEDKDGIQIEFPEYYIKVTLEIATGLPVKFEKIDAFYIPKEDTYYEKVEELAKREKKITTNSALFENLVYRAYQLADREEELKLTYIDHLNLVLCQ